MVGANASGKSNVLEAIRLLSWMAQGNKLSDLQDEVDRSDRVVRGSVKDLPKRGSKHKFEFGANISANADLFWKGRFCVHDHEALYLCSESAGILGSEDIQYETGIRIGINESNIPSFSDVFVGKEIGVNRSNRTPIVRANLNSLVLNQLESFFAHAFLTQDVTIDLRELVTELSSQLQNVQFVDPQPLESRSYVPLSRKRKLKEDGSNLSAVLYGLWNDENYAEANRENILSLVQSLPEQNIRSLSFIKTPREEVMFELVETFGGVETQYEAALLSDGTIRVMAIAAALLSTPEESLIIIEEIGNGVHPSRAEHLLTQINRIAEERNLQILISTHNPALLDALPIQAIGDVVFCYRDPEKGDSRLVKLESLPDYPELIAQGSVGDLLTEGILDRFVKHHPGSEEKKQRALDWLKSIG